MEIKLDIRESTCSDGTSEEICLFNDKETTVKQWGSCGQEIEGGTKIKQQRTSFGTSLSPTRYALTMRNDSLVGRYFFFEYLSSFEMFAVYIGLIFTSV